ncbi:MAG: hypothetical protein JRG91_10840 [Deltaproteobacteria bacterium]|nr:hypothetical protein [Deltaproteobacteria bacterium]
MPKKIDLELEITEEKIAAMLESAGKELEHHEALDFSGFNFEAIRQSIAEAKVSQYLPSREGKVPKLPETSESGEIVFDMGPASISIPASYAPYVRYVHEVFGTPSDEADVEFGVALKYFHTLRQWVGNLPGTLRDQIGDFLRNAGEVQDEMERRMESYADVMADDPNFEVVAHVPYMYAYLCRLMVDPGVPAEVKVDIAMGIVYFASPVDVLPEAFIDHPLAFADDACVALWVLKDLEGNVVTKETIEENWPGEAPLPASTEVWEKPLRELLGEDLVDAVNTYFALKRGRRTIGPR